MPVKQKFHPYTKWECYINGMWRMVPKEEYNEMLDVAVEFTGDYERYGKSMLRVITEWPITMSHNLNDTTTNHRPFIGHCAVCLELGIPEYITRAAWGQLTADQQLKANQQADIAYNEWLKQNTNVAKNLFE